MLLPFHRQASVLNSSLTFSWVKVHDNNTYNNKVDKEAKKALHSHSTVTLSDFIPPPGWVNMSLVLAGTPLAMITRAVVQDNSRPPLTESRCLPFLLSWNTYISCRFSLEMDAGLNAHRVWSLTLPPKLKELLWKEMTGSLPLGALWYGAMDLGRLCSCRAELSLLHIWTGCHHHHVTPLLDTLSRHVAALCPLHPSHTEDLRSWGHPWFPLLVLKELENKRFVGKTRAKSLKASRADREWAIGSYLWLIWTNKMNEIHSRDPGTWTRPRPGSSFPPSTVRRVTTTGYAGGRVGDAGGRLDTAFSGKSPSGANDPKRGLGNLPDVYQTSQSLYPFG